MNKHISKIIFVDDDFVSEFKSKDLKGYHEFIDAPLDTKIISLSSRSELDELLELDVVDAGQIRAGNIVVKSPCRANYYIPLSDLSEDVAVRKYDIFNAFCIALGAKKVSVAHFESNDYSSSFTDNTNAEASASTLAGGVQGEFNHDKSKKTAEIVEKRVGVGSDAEGGAPDIEKAKGFITKYGLQHDSLFESLLESCELTNNRLLSKEFLIDTSKDLEKIVDRSIKVRLEAMSKIYSAGGGFNASSVAIDKIFVAFQLRVKVEF